MSLFNTMGAIAGGYLRGQQLHQAEQLNQAHLESLNLQNELIKSRMGALQGLQGLFQPEQAQPAQQSSQQPTQGGMPWHPPLMPGETSESVQAAQKLLSPETNPLTQQSSSLLKAANFLASQGDQIDAEKYMGMAQKLSQMGMTASKEALAQRTTQLSNGIKEASFIAQAAGAGETPQAFQDSIKQGMQMGIIDPQMGQKLLQTPWTPALMQRLQAVGTTVAEKFKSQHNQAVLKDTEAWRRFEANIQTQRLHAEQAAAAAKKAAADKKAKAAGSKVVAAPTSAMINAAQHSLSQILGLDSNKQPALGNTPTIVAEIAQDYLKTNPSMTTAQAIQTAVSQLQASGAINVKDNSASVENSGATEYNPITAQIENGVAKFQEAPKGTSQWYRVPVKTKIAGKEYPKGSILKITW